MGSRRPAATGKCGGDDRVREIRSGACQRLAISAHSIDAIADVVAGIDVPLGWPVAFPDAVATHASGRPWPVAYRYSDAMSFRLRRTDVAVRTPDAGADSGLRGGPLP